MIYFYLYKITDPVTNNYYFGVHKTNNLEDGYMGSGVRLNKTIKQRSRKTIVEFFDNTKDMYTREKEIVTKNLLADQHCLNCHEGGIGGDTISNHPEKENIIAKTKQTMLNKSTTKLEEINNKKARRGKSNGMYGTSRRGYDNPMYGKQHSSSTKQKISAKARIRSASKDYINPNAGNTISAKQKLKISKANSKTYQFIKNNETIQIFNLAKYCTDHKLNEASMRHVNAGRQKQHKGYASAQ